MGKKVYDERITASVDWGGDESTGGLPVAGRRVQEFIKEQLIGKMGMFHFDTANNRYLVFADADSRDAYLADPTQTNLILGTFDAPFNYSAEITLSSPSYVAILSGTKNNYIDFTFDVKNKSGQSIGEDVICTYTFIKGGTKKTVTEKYRYGQTVHFNIDAYIGTGTNTITVGVVGQNTLAATTAAITYQVVDLLLSDTYDISQVYNLISNPAATAAIPYAVSGYGTKIMEWYLDGVLLDYVKVEDEIVDVSATRTKYISLANLSQGIHSLQYRAYTMVDGEKFYSNILYRDLIVVTGANKNPIIAVAATIPLGNDIITEGNLQLYGITQYVPYELTFATYNPTNVASTQAVIAIDGKTEATIVTHNHEVAKYSLRPASFGVKTVTITADPTVYTIGMNIAKSSTFLEEITEALQLDLQALGKSNNDADKEEWQYGLYRTTFNGFNWNNTSGWVDNRLLISAGAYMDITLSPLSPDPTATGKTLEFEFATANVLDDNAIICDLRNNEGAGLLITASEVSLISAGGAKISTKYKSEENIRIAFVVNRKTGVTNKGLVFIYVNGILSGAVDYAATDNFTSGQTLRIGNTTSADVRLKALRFYNTALSHDQILNNYILYRDDTAEMLSIYDKNNIYETGSLNFNVDALASQCPVMIFTGDIPTLENTTDKNKTIYVDVEYINMQDPSKSFTSKGTRLRPQGTSSMGYPKKNFRPYSGYGTMYDNLGNVVVDGLYAFAERSQPVNVWCLKADYAESSGTHNTGIARLWNDAMYNAQVNGEYVLRTEAQKKAIANSYEYDVRTTVDGFPCNVFYRLTTDSELVYIGKYNFNNDKSTESVFGFRDIPGFDNSRMQCWELLNNGNHLALFQDMTNFDAEWDKAYEARYPDKSTDVADLKSFSQWVVSTKGNAAKFKAEKWDHLDVYKVAAYYIYLMRFGAVDQVIKNAMLTSEDGIHWYFINYDNDTIIGVRNDGLLIYNYDIDRQTIDTSYTAEVYAYAGHDSTLWNNLEADTEFMQIVSEVDTALYMAGLSYEKVIDMFDNKQSGKWCERVYNQDAQYKYIGPYTDSGINNLYMAQGSRSAHRRWWLSHRFDLYDSKFVSGAYKAKSIEFKAANAPAGLEFSIVAGSNYYAGYGLNNVPVETGIHLTAGTSHTFTTKQVINVGDPVRVYSAVNVRELDIHDFTPYLSTLNIAEVYGDAVGTQLKKLVLGVNTASDSRRNTSLYNISGLSQAKRLEYLDISGYQAMTNIDLSQHTYLTTLKAYESGLTGLVLANGAPVSLLELPGSLQSLMLDNLPYLSMGGLKIGNAGRNLSSIHIKKCDALDISAFIFSWITNKNTPDNNCNVILEGIRWKNVNIDNMILIGSIKESGGNLSLSGSVSYTNITPEQVQAVVRIYGDSCFDQGAKLYFTGPGGLYITGPTDIPDGTTAQYKALAVGDFTGVIRYCLFVGGQEVTSYKGVTIDPTTGLLTAGAVLTDTYIVVRAKIESKISDIEVWVRCKTYPTSVSIDGDKELSVNGSHNYLLVLSPEGTTGSISTEWALTGDAVDSGLIAISSRSDSGCTIEVSDRTGQNGFILTATVTPAVGNVLTATLEGVVTESKIIMTSESNPEVLKVLYAAGMCANASRMLESEAKVVTDIGTIFVDNKLITHFEEFKYFTGIVNPKSESEQDDPNIDQTPNPGTWFCNCSNLEKIELPEFLTCIPSFAFYKCHSLASVGTIPSGSTRVFQYSFYETSIKDFRIKTDEGYVFIHRNAFEKCDKLESVYIYARIKVHLMYHYSFRNCKSLKIVTVETDPQSNIGVFIDGTCIFEGCTKLTKFVSKAIKYIGSGSFKDCISLESIELTDRLLDLRCDTLIPKYGAFEGCAALKSINIPNMVPEIPERCFFGCTALEEVTINQASSAVKKIRKSAFEGCVSLKKIISPNTTEAFYERCFYGCSKLETVDIDISKSAMRAFLEAAFYGCSSLKVIKIPSTFEVIYPECFYNCVNLKEIWMNHLNNFDIDNTAFGDSNQTYTGRNTYNQGINRLYVPVGATGYDKVPITDPLCNPEKCGFTISYTL